MSFLLLILIVKLIQASKAVTDSTLTLLLDEIKSKAKWSVTG